MSEECPSERKTLVIFVYTLPMNRIRYCSWRKNYRGFHHVGMLEVTNSWDIEKTCQPELVSWISEKHQRCVADLFISMNVDGTFGIFKVKLCVKSEFWMLRLFGKSTLADWFNL